MLSSEEIIKYLEQIKYSFEINLSKKDYIINKNNLLYLFNEIINYIKEKD